MTELAGDFHYDQPSPSALRNDVDNLHPLGSSVEINIQHQPLCDSGDNGRYNAIQVCPVALNYLPAGGARMSAVGLGLALNRIPSLVKRGAWTNGPYSSTPTMRCNGVDTTVATNTAPAVNRDFTNLPMMNVKIPSEQQYEFVDQTAMFLLPDGAINFAAGHVDARTVGPEAIFAPEGGPASFAVLPTNTGPINPSATGVEIMHLFPTVTGESIVLFVNLHTRTYAPQTIIHSDYLERWPTNASTGETSWLYNVVSKAGTPLFTVRLNPNGIFTTNATTTAVIYPGETYLRYVQTLPVSSPLPPMSNFVRTSRHTMARLTRMRATVDEMELEM